MPSSQGPRSGCGDSLELTPWFPSSVLLVDLSNLTIKGVFFSQNVQKALGTIVQQVSTAPPVYVVELLFSFKGIKRVEVPEERVHPS